MSNHPNRMKQAAGAEHAAARTAAEHAERDAISAARAAAVVARVAADDTYRDALAAIDRAPGHAAADSPPPTLSAAALEANAERAARGHAVVAAYPHDDDMATLAGDIIADLLHAIAATEGWDRTPEDVARVALAHYQAERDGDALDY